MNKFNVDMSVIVIDENNEIRQGVILSVYDSLKLAIVKFEDDTVEKVPFNKLGIPTKKETVSDEPVNDSQPIEGAKVISKKAFINALKEITTPDNITDELPNLSENFARIALLSMSVTTLGIRLTQILFGDNEETTITRADLTREILEITKPSEIHKATKGDISLVMIMSFELGIVFMTLVDKLFPESENE